MSNVDYPGPRILSLCTGIGGLELGVKAAFRGSRTVCMVEREAACVEILATRMEENALDPAPCWSDLKTFDGKPWRGAVDIITAGYPCQPFSQAGKGLAERDPRHLWPDVARIIGEVEPRVVVLENVLGHVNRGLKQVLEEVAELGFDAEWGVYSASETGAPHRRKRVFILAYRRGGGLEVLRRCGVLDRFRPSLRNDADGCVPSVADPSSLPDERRGERGVLPRPTAEVGAQVPQQHSPDDRLQALADGGSQRLEGDGESRTASGTARRSSGTEMGAWPPGRDCDWSGIPQEFHPAVEPDFRGMVDGVPNRLDRLRSLGNAVVPAQALYAITDLSKRILS